MLESFMSQKQSQSFNWGTKEGLGYEVVFCTMFVLGGIRLSMTSRLAMFWDFITSDCSNWRM